MDLKTCGFGRTKFGDYYKEGSGSSTYLKEPTNKCIKEYSFGKKKRFIQKAVDSFEKKGTKGSFTRWCKKNGFPKVTTGCINLGKRSTNLRTRRRAIFAQNVKRTSFGKKKNNLINDIKYLKSI